MRMDLTGQRFGNLVAEEGIGRWDNKHGRRWKCKCDCGKLHFVTTSDLRAGHVKRCGCCGRKLAYGEAVFNEYYDRYARNARKREYLFDLSKEQFRQLIEQPCYYCGNSGREITKSATYGGLMVNGIDRIDNNKGYIKGNVVACCTMCNYMKRDFGLRVFLTHVHAIEENVKSKTTLLRLVAG